VGSVGYESAPRCAPEIEAPPGFGRFPHSPWFQLILCMQCIFLTGAKTVPHFCTRMWYLVDLRDDCQQNRSLGTVSCCFLFDYRRLSIWDDHSPRHSSAYSNQSLSLHNAWSPRPAQHHHCKLLLFSTRSNFYKFEILFSCEPLVYFTHCFSSQSI